MQTRGAVCKIFWFGRAFDYSQPYNANKESNPATGTGFVLDAFVSDAEDEIFVVTAYHVVDFASKIMVEFANSAKYGPQEATLVCYDSSLDVALLRVAIDAAQKDDIAPLVCGESDAVVPNLSVQAAGFALGDEYQVTSGAISGRSDSRIQIDCAINGGNSGGPLLDASQRVLGVVVS